MKTLSALLGLSFAFAGCSSAQKTEAPKTPAATATPAAKPAPATVAPAAEPAPATVAPQLKEPLTARDNPAPQSPKHPDPTPPTPIDKTPIKADLSKFASTGPLKERDGHHGYDDGESKMFYWSNGTAETALTVPATGEYEITVTASCTMADGKFAKFKLHVDGKELGELSLTSEDARDYKATAVLEKGERKLGIEFTNDIYKENEYDLNFFVNGVSLKRVK